MTVAIATKKAATDTTVAEIWHLTSAYVFYGTSTHKLENTEGHIPQTIDINNPDIEAVAIGVGTRIGYTLRQRDDWKAERLDYSHIRAKHPEHAHSIPDSFVVTSDGVTVGYQKAKMA